MFINADPTIVHRYSAPYSDGKNIKNDIAQSDLPYHFIAIVDAGVTGVGSGSAPGLRTGTGWHPASILIFRNAGGTITGPTGPAGTNASPGAGGAGGPGGTGNPGTATAGNPGGPAGAAGNGQPGGIAFLAERVVIVDNGPGTWNGGPGGPAGSGAPGGGGGGGGGRGYQSPPDKVGPGTNYTGGRGGDGNTNSGLNSGWSGAPAGQGGSGGPAGNGGATGGSSPFGAGAGGGSVGPASSPGSVGPQGPAVSGNNLIIYISTGTRNGPINP